MAKLKKLMDEILFMITYDYLSCKNIPTIFHKT